LGSQLVKNTPAAGYAQCMALAAIPTAALVSSIYTQLNCKFGTTNED